MRIVVNDRIVSMDDDAPDALERVQRAKQKAYGETFEVDQVDVSINGATDGDYVVIGFDVPQMTERLLARGCLMAEEASGLIDPDLDIEIQTESTLVDGRPLDVVRLAVRD